MAQKMTRKMKRNKKFIYGFIVVSMILTFLSNIYLSEETNSELDLNNKITKMHFNSLIRKYRVNWNYPMIKNPWNVTKRWMTGRHVHPGNTPELGAVLMSMARRKIIFADLLNLGTQVKLLLTLEGGQKCVFRPKRYSLEKTNIWDGYNDHNAEIAAFHIGRILEFRRSPLVVGRIINIEKDIMSVASGELKKEFYKSNGNMCVNNTKTYRYRIASYQVIDRCQDGRGTIFLTLTDDYINCSNGTFEGSMSLWLENRITQKTTPWNRHSEIRLNLNDTYCNISVLTDGDFKEDYLFLDIIDAAIFDFLIGNLDRHMQYFTIFRNESMVLILDNAMAIRESTWTQLKKLQGIIVDILKPILDLEQLAPVLTQEQYEGLNRRHQTAINVIQNCIASNSEQSVVIKDL